MRADTYAKNRLNKEVDKWIYKKSGFPGKTIESFLDLVNIFLNTYYKTVGYDLHSVQYIIGILMIVIS